MRVSADGRDYLCMDQTLCEHGRCVHNTRYDVYQYHACQCDNGWHGEHCDENRAGISDFVISRVP